MATLGKCVTFAIVLLTVISCSYCSENLENGIDGILDALLARTNRETQNSGKAHVFIESGSDFGYEYKGLTILGLDSLKRTGACEETKLDERRSYYLALVGLEFLQLSFNKICKSQNECSSASLTVNDNSMRLGFTMTQQPCSVSLDQAFIQFASNITVLASNPNIKPLVTVDQLFASDVIPFYNSLL